MKIKVDFAGLGIYNPQPAPLLRIQIISNVPQLAYQKQQFMERRTPAKVTVLLGLFETYAMTAGLPLLAFYEFLATTLKWF